MTLVTIRPGVVFRDNAARSIRRIENQLGRKLSFNRTTVSYDDQNDLYRDWLAGKHPEIPLVLNPIYSVHVYKPNVLHSGVASDSDERGDFWEDNGWVIVNKAELWHREYFPKLDKHINDKIIEKERSEMLRVKSSATGNWYVIGEFTVTKIPAGKVGSANHARALAYTKAEGKTFQKITSKQCQSLIDDAATRAEAFNEKLAKEIRELAADEG